MSHSISRKPFEHREIAIWTILVIAVAFWANILRGTEAGDLPGLEPMITRVLNNGAFDIAAWILIFARFTRMYPVEPAPNLRIAAGLAIGLLVLAPVRLAPAIGLLIVGVTLVRDRATLPAGRQVGLVLLALALETFWQSRLLSLLHVLTARIDAAIVAVLYRLVGIQAVTHANVVENISNGFSIVIWPYCASSMPLAAFVLAFLVVSLYLGRVPGRRGDITWLLAGCAGSIMLTEIRLAFLGLGESSYVWWHDGPGVTIYTVAMLALAVLFPILAAREPSRPVAATSGRSA